jgi:hypothetical protein
MPRTYLFAAILAGLALPAMAQTQPDYPPAQAPLPMGVNPETGARPGNVIGTGSSLPTSPRASNITPQTSRSPIAPTLPVPPVGPDAGPSQYLQAARQALVAGHTGEAQEALERAETRMLDRSVERPLANLPAGGPHIEDINSALAALAAGNVPATIQAIDTALRR